MSASAVMALTTCAIAVSIYLFVLGVQEIRRQRKLRARLHRPFD